MQTTTLQQIQKDLQHLRQQQHTHKQAVEQIKNKYRQFHRQLNEKSFEYGDSEKQLNSRLNELEDQFAQFTDLTNKGDIEAAQEILSNLQSARPLAYGYVVVDEDVASLFGSVEELLLTLPNLLAGHESEC